METIKKLLIKYKSVISYLIFGVLTTVVNVVSYTVCYNVLGISNVVSTVIAWILAVLFAFVTNKLYVFDSKSFDIKTLQHEIPSFFGCRLLTGVLDVVIMYIAVDMMRMSGLFWKVVSNVLVIVLNYAASKLIIFRRK